MPIISYLRKSGVLNAIKSGNCHLYIKGDSISAPTNDARFYAGPLYEWGVKTGPIVGVRVASTDGVTDAYGRSFKGTSGSSGGFLKPGPGIEIEASGGSGNYTFGETVTESGTNYTAIFLGESGGNVQLGYGPGDNNAIVGGGSTLSGASASRTLGAVIGSVTTDPLGLPMNIFPGAHVVQNCTGNPGVSVTFYRSIMANTTTYPQGDWTNGATITGRLIYYRHAGGFSGKKRTYRNSVSQNSTNFSQATGADNTIAYTEQDCGNGTGVPCEVRWEALSADETGQFAKMCGAMFYKPSVGTGISLDSASIGGDGIASALDTTACSDAFLAQYFAATKRSTATTLIVMIWYGQNDAAMSQADFDANLRLCITRYTTAGKAAGYSEVKFILVAAYDTGGAHLSGKRDACLDVAASLSGHVSVLNLYDEYSAAYVAANTSDGIHPTLAFAREIAADMANEIATPTQIGTGDSTARSRSSSRSRCR